MGTRRPRPAPFPRSAFAGFRFPPDVVALRSAGTCGSACPTATSRSCSPSAASRSTTSPSTAGSCGSRRCWPRLPAQPPRRGTRWHVDGTYAKRATAAGAPLTGRSTRSGRSSTRTSPTTWHDGGTTVLRAGIGTTKVTPAGVGTDRSDGAGGAAAGGVAPNRPGRHDRIEADHGRLKARRRPIGA
jgi:hypothetical protein